MSGRGKSGSRSPKSPEKSSATKYLNSLKRRIYMGVRGGYFALAKGTGKKVYGAKALYMRNRGTKVIMKIDHSKVPIKIRRKVRSDKGTQHKGVATKATATNFLTRTGHRIMRGEGGAFFINKGGKRIYRAKAHKRKFGNSSPTNIGNHMAVPSPIRRAVKKV